VEQIAADDGLLRRVADSDGEVIATSLDPPVDFAALLTTCAHESTGADSVARALARAAADWLSRSDVRQLRFALLRIVANLD
jgi:hypothetical protein